MKMLTLLRASVCPIAGSAAALAATSVNAQEWRATTTVSTGAEVARNPYLEQGQAKTSAAASFEVRPVITYEDGKTRFDLAAVAEHREYATTYGGETNFDVSGQVRHRVFENLSLRALASASSNEGRRALAQGPDITDGVGTNDPIAPIIDPVAEDITILGTRGRTSALRFEGGANYRASARDTIDFSARFDRLAFEQANAADYRIFQVQSQYTRILDDFTSAGIIASSQWQSYDSSRFGDSRTVSLLGQVGRRFAGGFVLQAAVGANRTTIDGTALRPRSSDTSFAAQAQACLRNARRSACLEYLRSPQPTAFGGVRDSDRVAFNYQARISERDKLGFGASYARTEGVGAVPGLPAIPSYRLLGARGRYERRFDQRLTGYVEVGADDLRRRDLTVPTRAYVGFGVSLTFPPRQ